MVFMEERGIKAWETSILDDEMNRHGPTWGGTQQDDSTG